jgi:hypothetical protein
MILKSIIDRLNQRVEVSNIFDRIYGLCELTGDKGWIYYIGDGQAIPVTDYDSKQGTLFWAKRGKVNISKIDSLRVSGCKQMYSTKFNLSAYAIVRKSHLPCDGEDASDWVASRVYKLVSGRDYGFKDVIDVVSYEVIPNGYTVGDKTLPPNFEFATVVIELEVEIVSGSEDTCYDICNTGDIPLPPDFLPCTPCLTEVAVDGVTITGNGTPSDPLVAVGGGGGTPLTVKDEGTNVSTNTTTLNFTGAGVTASLTSPSVVEVNIPSGGGGVTAVTGSAPIASSGGATPNISISQATSVSDGYLSATDFNTFDGKQDALTAGTGIDLTGNIVTNTAPDQTVTLTAGTGISVSGTYPSFTIDNTAPSSGGTVTSVAATVPTPANPAFSVNVPNNTTTPSVDITANGVVSQYIRGDGSLANFPLGGGGGASVNYYLNGSISQGTIGGNAYYEMSRVPVLGGGTNFTRTNAQGNGYIAQFITDAGDPNLLAIPSGNWNFETYFSASSGGGNPSFYIELYKYDGATFTLISSGATNPEAITGGTVVDLYVSALAVPSTVLLATDRLAVRIFVTPSGRNITLHTEDNNLCQVITTFTTGLNALNGLTAQVQNFATGTAGTDFGISSASSTHTFNLPTASASNRGALSSGDWTTFNGKFNTPSGTTSQYVRGDGSLATFPTIPTGTVTSVGLTMPAAFSVANSPVTGAGTLAVTGAGTTAQYVRGDGSLATFPSLPTVFKTGIDSAGFSSLANTAVYTQAIPANTFITGDVVRVTYRTRKTGTAGNQTLRIYSNTTANLSGTPVLLGSWNNTGANNFTFNSFQRHLVIKNNTNNTEVLFPPTVTQSTDFFLALQGTTCVIDWSINQFIVFAIQNSSAADVNFGSMYLIEKL